MALNADSMVENISKHRQFMERLENINNRDELLKELFLHAEWAETLKGVGTDRTYSYWAKECDFMRHILMSGSKPVSECHVALMAMQELEAGHIETAKIFADDLHYYENPLWIDLFNFYKEELG